MSAPAEQKRSPLWRVASALLGGVLFLVVFVVMGAFLAEWIQSAGYEHVEGRIETFSSQMRLIRPVLLAVLVATWGFVFWALGRGNWIGHGTYSRAIAFWPHLAVWTVVIELGIGQGWLIPSVCLAFAVIFLRFTETGRDFATRARQALWSHERENDR